MAWDDPIVRVQPLNEQWQQIGTGIWRGITPEHVVPAVDAWGPTNLSFTLKRDPFVGGFELKAFTPIEVEIAGVVVWEGYVWETPTQDAPGQRSVQVTARGWQYALDDNVEQKVFVHSSLQDWVDARTLPTAPLGSAANSLVGAGQVSTGIGPGGTSGVTLMLPSGSAQSGSQAAVVLDLGPNSTAAKINLSWLSSNNDAASAFLVDSSNSPAFMRTGAGSVRAYFNNLNVGNATVPLNGSGSFSTPYRYVFMRLQTTAGAGTLAADEWVTVTAASVSSDASYADGSGNSILVASQVVSEIIPVLAPSLSSDLTQIGSTSFVLPDLVLQNESTAREIINAVNAFHAWRTKILSGKRMSFSAQPTAPLIQARRGPGTQFTDTSANAGETLYNRVVVSGSDPGGNPLFTTRTSATTTLLDRWGRNRTAQLPVSAALNSAVANQLGDTFLTQHARTPFKGALTVNARNCVRRVTNGESLHPAHLLLLTTELCRFEDMIDPDNGGLGRDGVIADVSYDSDTRTSSVSIDSTRQNFEALLARYAALVTPRLR